VVTCWFIAQREQKRGGYLLIFLLEICLGGLAVEAASQKPPHFIHTVWRFTSEVYETRGTNYSKQPIKFLLAKPFSFLPQLSFVGVFPSPGNTIYKIVLVCFRCYLLCKATSLVLELLWLADWGNHTPIALVLSLDMLSPSFYFKQIWWYLWLSLWLQGNCFLDFC
jgi:hypothetical protein